MHLKRIKESWIRPSCRSLRWMDLMQNQDRHWISELSSAVPNGTAQAELLTYPPNPSLPRPARLPAELLVEAVPMSLQRIGRQA